jgi:hypothetical protein
MDKNMKQTLIDYPTISEQNSNILAAMLKAKPEMKAAVKETKNTFFKSTYAELEAIQEACEPALAKYGLFCTSSTIGRDATLTLIVTIYHAESKEWIRTYEPLIMLKNDMQAYGAAKTYARRYGMTALCEVRITDDDGEAAMGRSKDDVKVTPKKQEETPAALITKDQLLEISEILKWLDKEFAAGLMSRVVAKYKISNIDHLPFAYFPTVIKFLKEQTSEKENDS